MFVLLRLVLIQFTIVLGFYVIRFALWLRKLNRALANVPAMAKPHWLLGNLREIRAGGGFTKARAAAFKALDVGSIKVYMGPVPVLVTRDLDFFKFIHNNQSNSPTPFVRIDAPMLTRVVGDTSIFVTDGQVWNFHRKHLDPLFRHKNLCDIYPFVVEHCQRLEQLWLAECDRNPITRSADVVIDNQMKAFSTGVIAFLEFSTDLGVLKSNEMHPMVKRFSDIAATMERLGAMPPLLQKVSWLPERRRLEQEVQEADEEMFNAIRMRQKLADSKHAHRDIIDLLLGASPPYTDRCIRDQCMSLYWAGQETTSLLMTWGLYYLARYPQAQQKLLESLQELPDTYSYEDLNRVEYLTYFVNETLRVATIAPSTVKQSSTDLTFYNGLQLPAGLWILSSLHDLLLHPKHFPDPLKFDPDRWADPTRHSMEAFVPFTKGEKTCIGQKLSIMEGKVLLAYAVTKFKLSEVPGFTAESETTFVCRPKNGMKLRITPRSESPP